jgi:hypothetical protein
MRDKIARSANDMAMAVPLTLSICKRAGIGGFS